MRAALFGKAAEKLTSNKDTAEPQRPSMPSDARAKVLAAMRGDKSARGSSLLRGALFGGGSNRLLS